MKALVLVVAALAVGGCTENSRARNFGGTAITVLPSGQHLVTATWKSDDLWLLTRNLHADETPETYTFKESSNLGLLNGTVIIKETK